MTSPYLGDFPTTSHQKYSLCWQNFEPLTLGHPIFEWGIFGCQSRWVRGREMAVSCFHPGSHIMGSIFQHQTQKGIFWNPRKISKNQIRKIFASQFWSFSGLIWLLKWNSVTLTIRKDVLAMSEPCQAISMPKKLLSNSKWLPFWRTFRAKIRSNQRKSCFLDSKVAKQ